MNTVTLGVRLCKNALRDFNTYKNQCQELNTECALTYEDFLERDRKRLVAAFLEGQKTVNMMRDAAIDAGLIEVPVTGHYFITIRPDTNKVTFDDFYELVKRFISRACFRSYRLSFEQKGVDDNSLGQGFHVHIVAHMRQRSKGEVLRDTQSSFNTCAAANCIDVRITKNPDDIVDKYLIAYEADDGHKAPTKEWDEKWRQHLGLKPLYVNDLNSRVLPLALSSPGRLVEFN